MLYSIFVVFIFTSTVYGGDDDEAKFRIYNTSFDDYVERPLKNATGICSIPWFDPNRFTIFFCHGFKGTATGPVVTAVIKAYLNLGEYNVILINWEKLAADIYNNIALSYTLSGVPNALQLGCDFADALIDLFKECLDLNKTHILGHSLCAHSMGITGNNMVKNGKQLPWITGLDPAGNIFNLKLPQQTLNPDSARFVDVIHSDFWKYGTIRSLGTVDFWANYGGNQPGCNPSSLTPTFTDEGLDPAGNIFNLKLPQQTLNPDSARFVDVIHSDFWKYGTIRSLGTVDFWANYGGNQPGCNPSSLTPTFTDEDLCNHYRSCEYLVDAQTNPGTLIGCYAEDYKTCNNYRSDQRNITLEIGKYDLNALPGSYCLTTNDESPFGRGAEACGPNKLN